jgi:hypothetical protein
VRKRVTVLIATIAVASIVLVLPAPAGAEHAGVFCAGVTSHGISNNDTQYPLWPQWINWSYWWSDLAYIALRRTPSGAETFRQWYPSYYPAGTNTVNGFDHLLETGIQRAGYAFAVYDLDQWSHDGCAS